MSSPVVVSRIQNRRGTQAQFNALYPAGYTGIGGFIRESATVSASGTGTIATLTLAPISNVDVTFSGAIAALGTVTPGGSYLPNIYEDVPLTGGTGTGARATININGAGSVGAVINNDAVVITNPGTGYTAGDVLSATTETGVFSTTGLGSGFQVVVGSVTNATVSSGPIVTFGVIAATVGPGWAGLNYLPGTYTAVPLVGGHGNGATADIIVDGATNVTTITLVDAGTGYIVGDELSASPADLGIAVNPTGSGLRAGGFIVPVLTISAEPPGPLPAVYTVGSQIVVAGITPIQYNGTFTVTGSSPTSVSYSSSAMGSQTGSGTISNFLNILMPGELALCTDTRRVFIGNLNGEYIELEMASDAGLVLIPSIWELPPSPTFVPITRLLPFPATVEYDATPFLNILYDVTDSAVTTDSNATGANFSKNGELKITAVTDFAPISNPPLPDTTSVTLTDTGTEINLTTLPSDISFIAQRNGTKIEILYMHDFPGSLIFSTSSIRWTPL